MYKVYDVQTFYGSFQKTFQSRYHAEEYFNRLARSYDKDLIELIERTVTVEEFCLENLED